VSGTSSPPPADERGSHVSHHRETDLATLLAGPAADADLVRLVTCGSVDDGKSTLIGRLLYDTKQVFVDQMEHVEETSERRGDGYVNLALLTDGLRAEREQGITIDVAYRSFVTERRRFQLADAPGHVQYTRNMVTGASTADIAVVLLDARKGVIEQTRRHTLIVSLLGVPHVVFAVNKMDLVDFDEARFREIEQELDALTAQLGVRDALAVPIAALHGDNVVDETGRMAWWTGQTLLAHLEGIETSGDRNLSDRRFPVQWVIRPMTDEHHDYRGYAGQVAGGVWRAGDDVLVLPSGLRTRVASVDSAGGPIEAAVPGMSVTIRLEDEIDVPRGDMLVDPDDQPVTARQLEATICWMSERPLQPGARLAVKHTTRSVRAVVESIDGVVDLDTLEQHDATEMALNDIGTVRLRLSGPLMVDPYAVNRATGSFILIGEATNDTVAAGMVRGAHA
jgi:bifunctional enzyme CysN/CysC